MKRTICRLLIVCVFGALLASCYPIPEIKRPTSIVGLDQHLKQVAAGDLSGQARLAQAFSGSYANGLGHDAQTARRLYFAAADRGDVQAQQQLADRNATTPDEMMESAYWAYRLVQKGNNLYRYMHKLGNFYIQPKFPAYDPVESCKWLLLSRRVLNKNESSFARAACFQQLYSDEVFQQAAERAQPLFEKLTKKP